MAALLTVTVTVDECGIVTPRLLEIGPGSGQATRALADRGVEITAVELGPNLVELLRRNMPEAEIVNAAFEDWEPEHADFDTVASFTAFHWLDPALKYPKAARLLRGGGVLAVAKTDHVVVEGGDPIWVELQEDYDAVVPSPYSRPPLRPEEVGDLRAEFEATGLFHDVDVRRYMWDVMYTADEWIDVLRTYSPHITRDAETTQRLLDRIHARIESRPGGRVTKHYLATLSLAVRD